MIIIKLCGGLGNQLFQYAGALAIAKRSGLPLKLDLGWFSEGHRPYDLDKFNISATVASSNEIDACPDHFECDMFQFDDCALSVRGPVVLSGYFQSDRYFDDISDLIREEFTLKDQESSAILPNTVAVSVRRGSDYGQSEWSSDEYYQEAMTRFPGATFCWFSDNPAWVESTFGAKARFTSPAADLIEASRCSNHIIAPSSWSWWAAWLCPNPHKIVITPNRWFINILDVIPEAWTKSLLF